MSPVRSGSSPRVWGQCRVRLARVVRPRFIPTCVGTVFGPALALRYSSVHPHVCGDSSVNIRPMAVSTGSSPRVWGQCNRAVRYIHTEQVHPHVCGDSAMRGYCISGGPGSSPRVWGQWHNVLLKFDGDRFIPTCVGTVDIVRRKVVP